MKKELQKLGAEQKKIVDSIIENESRPYLIEKADDNDERINYLKGRIEYRQAQQETYTYDIHKIRKYITKDLDGKRLKEIGPDAQKSIIQTYVEKVVVYHDHIDIYMIVDTNGEGGESRTHVRKHFHKNFSECS